MRIRLLSDRWRQKDGDDYRYYVKGDEIDVDDATGAWLTKYGAAIDLDAEPEPTPEPDPDPQPAEDLPDPQPAENLPERPLNAAKKEAWEDYYRKVKKQDPPKSMDKAEIIAAVGTAG